MRTEVIMPKMGFTMEEGTIARWFKSPGERIEKGDPLFEVATDKANMEVEAPESGILLRILAPEGATVPVTSMVAVIGEPGEEEPAVPIATPPVSSPRFEAAQAPPPASPAPMQAGGAIRATPAARSAARELGVDLAAIPGTGPDGTITDQDVKTFSAGGDKPSFGADRAPVKTTGPNLRRIIARNMSLAWSSMVMVTLMTEVDGMAMAAFRLAKKASGSPVTYTDLIFRASALALRENPAMNASWTDQGVKTHPEVNVGLAVDTERGLMVPVIRQADRKSLEELAAARQNLAMRTRNGQLIPDDLTGGTFTITNLGTEEIEFFTPIIRPPEGAVLGVGTLKDRPVCRDGQVVAAPVLRLSLTFDHRLIDGAPAARFLGRIRALLADAGSPVYKS